MVMHAGDMALGAAGAVWHLEDLRVGMSLPELLHRAARAQVRQGRACRRRRRRAVRRLPVAIRARRGHDDARRVRSARTTTTGRRSCPTQRSRGSSRPTSGRALGTARPFDAFRAVHRSRRADAIRLAKALYFEAKTFLHGLLVVEDKVSMAHSLEVRVPFLDNELVDIARRIPPRLKHGKMARALLRRAMRGLLPDEHHSRRRSRGSARPTSRGTAARRWTTSARSCSTRARSTAVGSRSVRPRVLESTSRPGQPSPADLVAALLRVVEPALHRRLRVRRAAAPCCARRVPCVKSRGFRQAALERAPNLATAIGVYRYLRAQRRRYRAGGTRAQAAIGACRPVARRRRSAAARPPPR